MKKFYITVKCSNMSACKDYLYGNYHYKIIKKIR